MVKYGVFRELLDFFKGRDEEFGEWRVLRRFLLEAGEGFVFGRFVSLL